MKNDDSGRMRPFVRKRHNGQVDDRDMNVIPRLIAPLRIPTCFRIAEALRELKEARFYIELYAVLLELSPVTEEGGQFCRVADLFFPAQPPFITASIPAALEDNTGQDADSPEHNIVIDSNGEATSDSETGQSANQLVRIIICPPSMLARVSDVSEGCSALLRATQSSLIPGDTAHVMIEAMWRTDWREVEYVRGIVDV